VKYMLMAGMLAWSIRYVLFAYGNSGSGTWMFLLGILLHGICYDLFFVTGQIYIDREAPPRLRAAAQGLITLITYGAGMLLGAWLSGTVVDLYGRAVPGGATVHNWQPIWLISGGCAIVVLVIFSVTFSDAVEKPGVPTERAMHT
jgi:MFS family permease